MKKHINFLTIAFLFLIIPFYSLSQMNYEDVVYLKNGTIIHGIIDEQIPNQSIKIQTKDGNTFVYKIEEVQKMTKEQVKNSNNEVRNTSGNNNTRKRSGYTNITELTLGLGLGDASEDYSYGIQTVNGYQFNPHFSLGFGVGVDKYVNATFLPLFVDFRINFLSTSVTPYFVAAQGYSLGFDGNKGGLFLDPSFGVKFFVSQKTALNFSTGFKYQENSFDYYFYYGTYTFKEKENLITLKFGVTF